MNPQGEGMAPGLCSKQGLPASQAAAPARGAGLQMDGRAMAQQAALREQGKAERGGQGAGLCLIHWHCCVAFPSREEGNKAAGHSAVCFTTK